MIIASKLHFHGECLFNAITFIWLAKRCKALAKRFCRFSFCSSFVLNMSSKRMKEKNVQFKSRAKRYQSLHLSFFHLFDY